MAAMKLTCLDCGQVNRIPQEKLSAGPKCGTCGAKLVGGKVLEVDLATLEKPRGTMIYH
jgi:thioredoxin 2